jgi:DNA repair/transcription protein MET18/MMS19
MGDDSLLGIVTLISGEKDPRNLMIMFSMLRVIMIEWDISSHAEMLFDAVFAYFPITFRPPPNDPYGITAQDLKNRLRDCLASNGEIAPWVFPALLDKLETPSPATKKDVLQALAACGKNYETPVMARYSITLWDSVKYEILTAQEVDLADEALLVLEAIAEGLSESPGGIHQNSEDTSGGIDFTPTSTPLEQYLKPVNKESLEHLHEPAQRQAKASGDILKAVASANTSSFGIVAEAVVPQILVIYQSFDGISQKRAILEVLNQMLEAAIKVFGTWKEAGSAHENPLKGFKDNLVALYSQALMATVKEEVSFRLAVAKGLLSMAALRYYLEGDEIGLIIQHFNEIMLKEESYGRDELKKTAMTGLAEISRSKPQLIMDITFPAFLANLPEDEESAEKVASYQSTLEGLAEISVEKEPFETLCRRLLNKFDTLARGPHRQAYPYTCALLSTLLFAVDRNSKADPSSVNSYFPRVVVEYSKAVASAGSTESLNPFRNSEVLDLLGRVGNLLVRTAPIEQKKQVGDNVYTLFASKSMVADRTVLTAAKVNPESMILSTWLMAGLPKDLQILAFFDSTRTALTLNELLSFTKACTNPAVQLTCLRQLSLCVNKHLGSQDLEIANSILMKSFHGLQSSPMDSSDQCPPEVELRIIFAISKGLILRITPNTNIILERLLSLLNATEYPAKISSLASSGFSSILAPDDVLSKMNGAQIRLLAPQRVFQTLTPLIAARFRETTSSEEKENFLTALSGILSTLPSEIVMPELPTLLPLLLQSLDLADQNVKVATLQTLAVVIAHNPAALEESGHVPALAKRLLSTATLPKSLPKQKAPASLPRTRRLATTCIALMPPHITGRGAIPNPLLALKREVLQRLTAVLDDPRRDVRKEAVDAKAAWIRGVGDIPDDDDED